MNLFLLRHAIAVERGTREFAEDSLRPLTPEGRRKMRRSARGLAAIKLRFDWIFTSPYVRAKQTADIVVEVFKAEKRLRLCAHLAHNGDTHRLVAELNRICGADDNVLLVGHEPDLSRFASLLLAGSPGFGLELKKGGLCKLEAERLRHGRCATLQWLLAPKLMARLS